MIGKKYRFHVHKSLNYVFSKGQGERSKFFAIKFINNPRRRHPRLAVVVSKKVFKSAVKRNRIRRRIYEIARPLLVNAQPVDIVLTVYSPEVLTATHDELTIQLLPLLHKTNITSAKPSLHAVASNAKKW